MRVVRATGIVAVVSSRAGVFGGVGDKKEQMTEGQIDPRSAHPFRGRRMNAGPLARESTRPSFGPRHGTSPPILCQCHWQSKLSHGWSWQSKCLGIINAPALRPDAPCSQNKRVLGARGRESRPRTRTGLQRTASSVQSGIASSARDDARATSAKTRKPRRHRDHLAFRPHIPGPAGVPQVRGPATGWLVRCGAVQCPCLCHACRDSSRANQSTAVRRSVLVMPVGDVASVADQRRLVRKFPR